MKARKTPVKALFIHMAYSHKIYYVKLPAVKMAAILGLQMAWFFKAALAFMG